MDKINFDAGTKIDEWEIVRFIGEGAFSKVYSVKSERFPDKTWAMKIAPRKGEGYSSKFKAGNAFTSLNWEKRMYLYIAGHGSNDFASIPDVMSFYKEHADYNYIVIEQLWCSLEDILNLKIKISNDDIYKIGSRLLRSLSYIHTKMHYVFRDIKPSNIMIRRVDDTYDVVFTDLGTLFHNGNINDFRKVVGTGFVGNELYCSPHMINRPCAYCDDLVSLGFILYQLYTNNSLPWIEAKNPEQLQQLKLNWLNTLRENKDNNVITQFILSNYEYDPNLLPEYHRYIKLFEEQIQRQNREISLFSDNASLMKKLAKIHDKSKRSKQTKEKTVESKKKTSKKTSVQKVEKKVKKTQVDAETETPSKSTPKTEKKETEKKIKKEKKEVEKKEKKEKKSDKKEGKSEKKEKKSESISTHKHTQQNKETIKPIVKSPTKTNQKSPSKSMSPLKTSKLSSSSLSEKVTPTKTMSPSKYNLRSNPIVPVPRYNLRSAEKDPNPSKLLNLDLDAKIKSPPRYIRSLSGSGVHTNKSPSKRSQDPIESSALSETQSTSPVSRLFTEDDEHSVINTVENTNPLSPVPIVENVSKAHAIPVTCSIARSSDGHVIHITDVPMEEQPIQQTVTTPEEPPSLGVTVLYNLAAFAVTGISAYMGRYI